MSAHHRSLFIGAPYALVTFIALEIALYSAIRFGTHGLETRIATATKSIQTFAPTFGSRPRPTC